jgi:hypothetical protein
MISTEVDEPYPPDIALGWQRYAKSLWLRSNAESYFLILLAAIPLPVRAMT